MSAAAMLASQRIAVAPVQTSMLSVTTPKRNGYERLHTVVASSMAVMTLNCLPQKRSMPTAGVVIAAMVEVCPLGIWKSKCLHQEFKCIWWPYNDIISETFGSSGRIVGISRRITQTKWGNHGGCNSRSMPSCPANVAHAWTSSHASLVILILQMSTGGCSWWGSVGSWVTKTGMEKWLEIGQIKFIFASLLFDKPCGSSIVL